jgi:hypothetical protein
MATGDTLCIFAPQHDEPPASAPATLDLRNEHPVLDFDSAAPESARFSGAIPSHYGGGGLNVVVAWAATSATSGDVVWSAAFERHAAGDADFDADGFGAAQSAVGAAPAVSGALRYTTIAIDGADLDDAAAGEHFRLRIARVADDASDTMSGDAELVSVEIQEA